MKRKVLTLLALTLLTVSSIAVYISEVKFEGLSTLTPEFIVKKGKRFVNTCICKRR